ncbi:tRNA epoxyqueuosine(34) reductase QueG [Bacteroidales bacterium OttesenSCG-928-E04]|nr:tRNA epoxyqueuosine(34) reductase QueG [Bacteroidales bacterium OttesenSCG-928-E04]MDL2326626.1 tRNA epoxyqueuosine(34) reductase QueG [Bacteroidales bacterium OttesenSCG-928-A14]
MDLAINVSAIKEKALSLGFSECGIASAAHLHVEQSLFEKMINQNRHAGMNFLERDIARRFAPDRYLSGCKSIIVCLFHYPTNVPYNGFYKIARYAHQPDYHVMMKEKLEELAASICEISPGVEHKTTVDTAPVSEKNWAVKAGLGSIGKNTLFRSEHGSFCWIGTILTTLVLPPDPEKTIPCGDCDLCVTSCPTGALKPYQLDCGKCLSFFTTESKGELPDYPAAQPWIFGCDVCQEICPHNQKALQNRNSDAGFSLFSHLQKTDFDNLTEEQFRMWFKGTSMERRKFERIKEQIRKSGNSVRM